jgi:acylphosphatase
MSGEVVLRAWRIFGRVQGVGFRWHTVQRARTLGLEGRVWNRPDGSVEVHARGPDVELEALGHWLEEGPVAASVTRVESLAPGPEAAESGFKARLESGR